MNLSGKRVVVVGAAGALGEKLCELLALEHDARVVAVDINEIKVESICQAVIKLGGVIEAQVCDITNSDSLNNLVSRTFVGTQAVDVWINCAGTSSTSLIAESSYTEIKNVLDINLYGTVMACEKVVKEMERAGSGMIVNISSVAGDLHAPHLVSYAAAKSAVNSFTRSLQYELEMTASTVKTLLVCPGFFHSPMVHGSSGLSFPEWLKFALSTPEKVAKEIVVAITREKKEIYPGVNGKLLKVFSPSPKFFKKIGHRALLSRSVGDFLWNKLEKP